MLIMDKSTSFPQLFSLIPCVMEGHGVDMIQKKISVFNRLPTFIELTLFTRHCAMLAIIPQGYLNIQR